MAKNKKIFFFDTETSGLVQRDKITKELLPLEVQPHILQFGGIKSVMKDSWEIVNKKSFDELFNPWIVIPDEMTKIHWVSNEMIKGKPTIHWFLWELIVMLNDSDYIVWHNVTFDIDMLEVELIRIWHKSYKELVSDWRKKVIDTMLSSVEFCKIPPWHTLTLDENGKEVLTLVWKTWNGFKWARLSELHIKLYGFDFDNQHNAMWDILATQKCLIWLLEKWVVKI